MALESIPSLIQQSLPTNGFLLLLSLLAIAFAGVVALNVAKQLVSGSLTSLKKGCELMAGG